LLSYAPTPAYVFMAWYLVKHRITLAFYRDLFLRMGRRSCLSWRLEVIHFEQQRNPKGYQGKDLRCLTTCQVQKGTDIL